MSLKPIDLGEKGLITQILDSGVLVTQSCLTLCNLRLQPTRLLCPWDSPGKNTGVGCQFLLQGIFLNEGLNLGFLHCRQILYHLCYQGKSEKKKKLQSQAISPQNYRFQASSMSHHKCLSWHLDHSKKLLDVKAVLLVSQIIAENSIENVGVFFLRNIHGQLTGPKNANVLPEFNVFEEFHNT